MLKVLDLFSGIGGFSLGLESTGYFETIAFCEKDEFCQKVLQKNFKNIPIEGEIRNVKGEKYQADVVTGGFPCQPFSVAGKRKGTDDDRYLWDETIRVVRECKPKYFIGENVEGIINIQEGMVLRQVQTDLEKEGFEVQCLIIPASGIGAWHQRKRVWIIGCNVSNSNNYGPHRQKRDATFKSCNESKEWLSFRNDKNVPNSFGKLSSGCSSTTRNSESKFKRLECNQSWNWNEVWSKTERCSEQDRKNVSNSECKRLERLNQHSSTISSSQEKRLHFRNESSKREERQQTWWETQSNLCGVPNGVSYELDKDRAKRIKALGNSIVPQIARELGKAIIEAENVSNTNLNGHK